MSDKKYAKKARLSFGTWCAMYVIFDVGSSIYVSYQRAVNGIDPTKFLSGFQLWTLAVVALIFFPSLLGIYHITKHYESRWLKKIVGWLLIVLSIWTVAMVVCTIAEMMIPGFLT